MKWKLSMPPANEWQQFNDQLHQVDPGLDSKVTIEPGHDKGMRWQFNPTTLQRVGEVLGKPFTIRVGDVREFMQGYGVSTYAILRYNHMHSLGGAWNYAISVNPLLSPQAANYCIWHEIQHMFQLEEKMHNPADANPHNLPMIGPTYEKYYHDPAEVDADQMATMMHEIQTLPLVSEIPATEGCEAEWYQDLIGEGWSPEEAERELGIEEAEISAEQVIKNRDRITKVADLPDYQGWSNWETWNTKLMIDNEREIYDESRKLVEKYENDMEGGIRSLENWAVQKVIGPHNAQAINDAQEWNDIPEDERVDHHYEELKEKSEQAADFVDALGFGKDVSDVDPQIIDPNLVNWIEIWNSIHEEVLDNRAYEEERKQNPPKVKPLGPAKFQVGQRVFIVTPSQETREKGILPGVSGTIEDTSSWQNSYGDTGRIYIVKHDDGTSSREYEGGLRLADEPHESGLYVGATVGYQGIKCKIIDGPYDDSGFEGRAWRIAPLHVVRGEGWYAKNAPESELTPLEGPLDPQDTQPGELTLPPGWSHIR